MTFRFRELLKTSFQYGRKQKDTLYCKFNNISHIVVCVLFKKMVFFLPLHLFIMQAYKKLPSSGIDLARLSHCNFHFIFQKLSLSGCQKKFIQRIFQSSDRVTNWICNGKWKFLLCCRTGYISTIIHTINKNDLLLGGFLSHNNVSYVGWYCLFVKNGVIMLLSSR